MSPTPTLDIEELERFLAALSGATRFNYVKVSTDCYRALHGAAPALFEAARERDTLRARVAELEAERDRLRGLAEAALPIVQLSAAESPRAAQMWLAVAFEEFASEEPSP